MAAAKSPQPSRTKSSKGRLSKSEKYAISGQRIAELEKEYAGLPARSRNELAELMVRRGIPITPEVLETVVGFMAEKLLGQILQEIRGAVAEDQTYPVPAKYLGRALKDMKAVGEPAAKNRIAIMAFFHVGFASAIIRAPLAGERDYRHSAKECYEYLKGIVPTNTESNNASKGLDKPARILESLRLADHRRAKTTGDTKRNEKEKRDAIYLRGIGGSVFDEWPLWPDEE